ncbi:unannotated protein [freshwater metagenome]|uniref:Unannotated protein n=1 Tax=freshwater metagenome TaxID=449393 RepID=A0A6J7HQB7_9ZZZZ|nr:hypothetical protein [Actinomycetota bacterium]
MIDRIPGGRRSFIALVVSLALFAAVVAVLAVTMARGDDPALGSGARAADVPARQAKPRQTDVPQGTPPGRGVDPDGDNWQGGGRSHDDAWERQGAPQGGAQQQGDWGSQQGPPVRSGTS